MTRGPTPAPGSPSAEPELHLLERCRNGDSTAFDEIVARHQNRIYNLCYWMLSDAEDAADAAQDAFVRAFRSLGQFRGDCAFSTWLHRIAVNVSLDAARRRQRAPVPFTILEHPDEAGELAEREQEPGDAEDDPAAIMARSERRQALYAALEELPEHQRMVLVLFDIQGHAYEAIAELLELPIGTVKSRLSRARLALRDKLDARRELFLN